MRQKIFAGFALGKWFLLWGGVVLLIFSLWQMEQADGSVWGKYYMPHADSVVLEMNDQTKFRQTIHPQFSVISGLLLQVEAKDYENYSGLLEVFIKQNSISGRGSVPVKDFSSTGFVMVPLEPLKLERDKSAEFTVSLVDANNTVGLRYQRDSKKLLTEKMYEVNGPTIKGRSGHLAFRVLYHATPREVVNFSLGQWLGMVVIILWSCGLFWWLLGVKSNVLVFKKIELKEIIVVLAVGLLLGLLIWFSLGPANYLPVNADMAKDMIYLHTASASLRQEIIPFWQHATCGGQPLLGNPETGILSLGLPFSLLFGPVAGLKILLSLEVAFLTIGMFFFARLVGLRFFGSLLTALVLPLSGFVVNRILIGHTMFIGGIAFMPWILATGYLAIQKRGLWLVISAFLIVLTFFRGDTHLVAYTMLALGILTLVVAIRKRDIKPIVTLGIITVFALGLSMLKLLPVMEGQIHFRGNDLPPLVVPLFAHDELLNVYLNKSLNRDDIDVLNGEFEGWENISLYVGKVPFLLALIGFIVAPKNIRLMFGVLLLLFLFFGEGALYHKYFQNIPFLGQMFRLPSRMLVITLVAGLVLAGSVLDWIVRKAPGRSGFIIAGMFIVAVLVNLGWYAQLTLNQIQMVPPLTQNKSSLPYTGLAMRPNTNLSNRHPLTLIQAGAIVPEACQDFNRQPPFKIKESKSVAEDITGRHLPVKIEGNEMIISSQGSSEIIKVRSMDSRLLSVNNGFVVPVEEQIDVLEIVKQGNPVSLSYTSKTARSGAYFSAGLLMVILGILIYRWRPAVREFVSDRD